jgi:thymidylate synthase (FAD)
VFEAGTAKNIYEDHMRLTIQHYDALLMKGVAKEQARILLPLSQYTQVWWTASFQSIMNFIELRDEPTSQVEIQEYARALKTIMLDTFPETTKLWSETYWK